MLLNYQLLILQLMSEMKKDNALESYLSFRLGDEIFALNVEKVHKILELQKITEVPRAPDYMKGVINLRGDVLPVVDTRIKFGLPSGETTKNTSILVVEAEIAGDLVMLGMLVDAVNSVLKIELEDLLPPPSLGNQYKSGFISNMARVKDKFFIILNIDAVFSTDDYINLKDLKGFREQKESTDETQEEEKSMNNQS